MSTDFEQIWRDQFYYNIVALPPEELRGNYLNYRTTLCYMSSIVVFETYFNYVSQDTRLAVDHDQLVKI